MSLLSKLAVKTARRAAKDAEKTAARGAERAVEKKAARAGSLAVKPKAAAPRRAAPKALPAPPKPLALPKPGPGLPSFAVKPKGGQWYVNDDIVGANFSPEYAAQQTLPSGVRFSSGPTDVALREWYERALPRYIKNDLGTPDDPLRGLAERGLLHIPGLDAEGWSALAADNIIYDQIGDVLLGANRKGGMPGAGSDLRGEVMTKMPWLAKAPVTDNVYGTTATSLEGLQLPHVVDEMRNALQDPAVSGFPHDLAVRPESLGRMGFPQAVEHVGRINQWRAKQAEQAALSAMDSPAIHTFKEYAENNPMGLRWVELKAPGRPKPPEEWGWTETGPGQYQAPDGTVFRDDPDRFGYQADTDYWHHPLTQGGTMDPVRDPLQQALKYEGDTMGHCVGGYCDDVLGGRSRIFSLRDAKGEPHVTIETAPAAPKYVLPSGKEIEESYLRSMGFDARVARDILSGLGHREGLVPYLTKARSHTRYGSPEWQAYEEAIPVAAQFKYEKVPSPESIVQIKGKQNRAPKDDYLPFVQDFVKSGQWGNVGDLGNTGLVKLPDGRYITEQQYAEAAAKAYGGASVFSADLNRYGIPDDEWEAIKSHFEGYAIGGRVAADRCFCKHPMSVKK